MSDNRADALLGCCVLLVASGCVDLLPPQTLDALRPVHSDTGTYSQRDADPLAQVADGAPRNSLNELDGCWGAYIEQCGPRPDRCLAGYQVLRFDAQSGRLTRYTLQNLSVLDVLDVWEGTVEIVAAGELRFRVTRVESDLRGITRLDDITERNAELPQYSVRVTLDSDELKAAFVTPADNLPTPAGCLENIELIHRRLECAE